jgi:hypothetical protein
MAKVVDEDDERAQFLESQTQKGAAGLCSRALLYCATGKHEVLFSVYVLPADAMPSVERLGTKGKTTKHSPSQLSLSLSPS